MAAALPLARTSAEAHVYMDLHPCTCGTAEFARDSAVIEAGPDLASRYTGVCPDCGAVREFVFRLPDRPAPPMGEVDFGDGLSELLDPGEWLHVADRWAAAAPQPRSDMPADEVRRGRQLVAGAAAAMDQVLAAVPAGGEEVPPDAFATELGRQVWAAEPGRFYRDRLEVVRDTYREVVEEYDAIG